MSHVAKQQRSIRNFPNETDNVMIFTFLLCYLGGTLWRCSMSSGGSVLHVYLSHVSIDAIMLGTAAHVSVTGDWNDDLMEQAQPARAIQ